MKVRLATVVIILLAAVRPCMAQGSDICQFLGDWSLGNTLILSFSQNYGGSPICISEFGVTNNVAYADGRMYVEYKLKDAVSCCDTLESYVLLECEIKGDSMEVVRHNRERTKSPLEPGVIINDVNNITFYLHKTSIFKCREKQKDTSLSTVTSSASTTSAYVMYVTSESLKKHYFFTNAIKEAKQDVIKYADSELREGRLSQSDYNLIVGSAYRDLAELEHDVKKRGDYFKRAVQHLPNTDSLFAEVTYAHLMEMELLPNDSLFQRFAFYSNTIKEYKTRGCLSALDTLNLKLSLLRRAGMYCNYIYDTVRYTTDLGSASSLECNIWPELDMEISTSYAMLAGLYEAQDVNDSHDSIVQEYYKKARECFKRSGVDLESDTNYDLNMYYIMFALLKDTNIENNPEDSDPLYNAMANLLYRNKMWSYANSDLADFAIKCFQKTNRCDSLVISFYDSIISTMLFDFTISVDYLSFLLDKQYAVDDVRRMSRRLMAHNALDKAQTARIKIELGDFDDAFADLLGNEKVFDSIIGDTSIHLAYEIIAMRAGKILGYEKASDVCLEFINKLKKKDSVDKAFMQCWRGVYLLKEADTSSNLSQQKKLRKRAREELRQVIDNKDTISMAYAYYWLDDPDSALEIIQAIMYDNCDSSDVLYAAADIYCLRKEYEEAKNCVDDYLQNTAASERPFYERTCLKYSDNLEGISGYVDSICAIYDSLEIEKVKRITFDTLPPTVIECTYTRHGSIYMPCRIGNIDTLIKFDPGADYMQITRDIACKLSREGHLNKLDERHMTNASGANNKQSIYLLDSIMLGEYTLRNVVVTVAEPGALLLLGQSVLGNFIIETDRGKIKLMQINETR